MVFIINKYSNIIFNDIYKKFTPFVQLELKQRKSKSFCFRKKNIGNKWKERMNYVDDIKREIKCMDEIKRKL